MTDMRFWLNLGGAQKPVRVERPAVAVEEPETPVEAPEQVQAEQEAPVNSTVEMPDGSWLVIAEGAEKPQAVSRNPFRGGFIETESGFLRLDLVQRFEVWEPFPGKWRADAYVDQYLSVPVGTFQSEAEARETVIRLLGGS